MIAGYTSREQLEAQLRAFEHERRTARSDRHLEAIAAQEAIFKAELERVGAGDYPEAERVVQPGHFAWIGEYGHPSIR